MSKLINPGKFILFFLVTSLLFIQACDKESTDESSRTTSGKNADLIRDVEGKVYINAIYNPSEKAKFRYKVIAETVTSEKSPVTEDQEVVSNQTLTYFYSQEVDNVTEDGVATYKMIFDSIFVNSNVKFKDSVVTEIYNSNIQDSVYNLPDFIQYNALLNQSFFLRVDKVGDILDVYGLEKVYENIYKALGDTLNEQDKSMIRESFGKDAIKGIVQNQFQLFPGNEVTIDSAWTKSYETTLLVFPVRNNLSYKVTGVNEENGNNVLHIQADLGIDFLNKEISEQGAKYTLNKSEAGGSGQVKFDISRGCIVYKNTKTNIELDAKLSAQGQSLNSLQKLSTNLTVELLQ